MGDHSHIIVSIMAGGHLVITLRMINDHDIVLDDQGVNLYDGGNPEN